MGAREGTGPQRVLTLRDIMTPDPVTVDESMTLREAVEVLRAAGVSGAPVLRGETLVGVLSATDILEFEVEAPNVPREQEAEVEVEEPSDEDLDDAPGAYFVDRWSDAEADVWIRISESDGPEWDRLQEYEVAEVMSQDLIALPPDASIALAARRMVDEQVHRVLVLDGDELIGVVSSFDIVRSVAESAEPDH